MAITAKKYNQNGDQIGTVDLPDALFGIEPNESIVHQYVTNYLANQRQGTHSAKTRAEVSGGGIKPWRQKGTGRARAGTIRSPLWRHGGIVFPPKPRSYYSKFPKAMKRTALLSALSDRAKAGRVAVIDTLLFPKPRTAEFAAMMKKLNLPGKKALFLDEGINENATLSSRNIPNVKYGRAATTNAYEALDADMLIFTTAGLAKAEEVFSHE